MSAGPQLPGTYSCSVMIELHEASESVAAHELYTFTTLAEYLINSLLAPCQPNT